MKRCDRECGVETSKSGAKLPAGERLYPADKRGHDSETEGRKSGASRPTAPRSENANAEQSAGRLLPARGQRKDKGKGKRSGKASVPDRKSSRDIGQTVQAAPRAVSLADLQGIQSDSAHADSDVPRPPLNQSIIGQPRL